ncbi:MAG: YggT family protein [Chlamydiales bacterium]
MIIDLIDTIFMVYMIMLFIRILGSWFPEFQGHTFMRFIAYYTDPYLNLFRRIIPPLGMIDFSPIIAFFALHFIEIVVKSLAAAIFL